MSKHILRTKKEKAWCDLLNRYNRLIEEKEYNQNLVDSEALKEAKEQILQYLQGEARRNCEADSIMLVRKDKETGLTRVAAEEHFSHSWPAQWARRADNIIAAVNEERVVEEKDMEDSYYELTFLGGRFGLWKSVILLTGLVVAIVILTMM